MSRYRIAAAARLRLLEIYDYSRRTFGEYQAEAYQAGIGRTFGLLADFPKIGTPVDELRPGYRRYRFQSHYIFCNGGSGRHRDPHDPPRLAKPACEPVYVTFRS